MGLRDRIWALVMGYGPRDLGFKVGIWALRQRIELRGDRHTRKRRRRRRKLPVRVKAPRATAQKEKFKEYGHKFE